MDNQIIEITVEGKNYALVPLCTFHDLPTEDRDKNVVEQFGLKEAYKTLSLFEIVDERKMMMAKLKYCL
jgi:hypothetical protein